MKKTETNTEMKDEVIEELTKGLDSLDQQAEIDVPNINWFENYVAEQKLTQRKRLIKDLCVFAIVALFVLSTVLFTLYQQPYIFLSIQTICIVFITFYTIFRYKKKVKSE
ncbi:YxlC family protein [Cytobacillus purgationiresistens]|uniref:YxlC family protein n=1 Tax=Cytobacillus purgationiresistens TaxID=863449 RepID=A0ABU0ACJ9_9BACI|nr:YxlC family protein [Cytobacillus purgationiresistens]MDQ0268978.1 hypothetical protein [Cytobacillus purgationiresistens]